MIIRHWDDIQYPSPTRGQRCSCCNEVLELPFVGYGGILHVDYDDTREECPVGDLYLCVRCCSSPGLGLARDIKEMCAEERDRAARAAAIRQFRKEAVTLGSS
jgi:hypothetical protein